MKARHEKTITCALTLEGKEIAWLRGLLQNPPCAPEDEPEEEAEMRSKLFNFLKECEEQ